MKPLICDNCKQRVQRLVYRPGKEKSLCENCLLPTSQPIIGVKTLPTDGLFLEHVSPKGHRFFSKHEMLEYERTHDVYIDCAHD